MNMSFMTLTLILQDFHVPRYPPWPCNAPYLLIFFLSVSRITLFCCPPFF